MAWQVAVVLDSDTDLASLLGWLPVWAWSTPQRSASAKELRESWGSCWEPEPALTLINTPIDDDPVGSLLAEIPTLELHHPRMTAVHTFGLSDSSALQEGMDALGYRFFSAGDDRSLLFARPMSVLEDVAELELNAAGWCSSDDVYDAFFKAVGAPEWHGRNFDALNDSIGTGSINKTEVPYRIVIRNAGGIGSDAAAFVNDFEILMRDLQSRGCPVEMRIKQ
jgi:Barstar (barnase inhibitor)